MKKALMVAVAVFTGLSICLAQDAAYVWVEGEDPATQNMHQHNW